MIKKRKIESNKDILLTKCEDFYLITNSLSVKNGELLRKLKKDKKIKNISIEVEYEENILDDIEKKYLKNIIKPFIDEVDYITKWKNLYDEEYSIIITLDNYETITLPSFPIDSKMYVGMEPDKEYSLKDLKIN